MVVALALALALAVPVVAQEASSDPLRLDQKVVPTHQKVSLRIDPDSPKYDGVVVVDLNVSIATDTFRFHAEDMELQGVVLIDAAGASVGLSYEAGEANLVAVTCKRQLAPGQYTLSIEFANEFDTTSSGLYRVIYEKQGYLFTQFEDDDARKAFPCWDEPAFKIPWDMTLSCPESQLVIFNTPERSVTVEDGWRTVEYASTPPLPSYLLAMAAGPFELVPIEGMSVPGNIVCPAGRAGLAGDAARVAAPILGALERYFDRGYPFEKLDLIAVPEFWPGAMENPGAITFRDTILLLDPNTVTVSNLRTLASVTAHEMAHMWFGDLVTMEWWDDLWLNESFATWLGRKVTNEVYPEYGIDVSTVEADVGAMSSDAQLAAEQIRKPVMADDMKMTDAALTYQKGAAVLGMFESFIGEDLFREGIVDYIEKNEWSNARADDLWSAIETVAGVDVASAMSTFLDQPGVPRIDATVLGDGRIELRQRRFLNHGNEDPVNSLWQIPVVFKYSEGDQVKTHKVMLREETQIVELPGGATPEWIHPNAGERGYYHWNVTPQMLRDLAANSAERLDKRERVALVGHLSALLDSGDLDGGSYLEATGSLGGDPDAEVIDALLSSLGKVRAAFVTPDRREAFAGYVRHMLRPVADRYGYLPADGEPEAVNMFRPALLNWLGIQGRDPDVIAFAKDGASRYLEDSTSVPAQIAGICLRIAALDGDWKLYNTFKERFEAAEIPAERSRYLSAMGYFENPGIAKAALNYAIDGEARPQEMFSIIQGVGTLHGDEGMVWDWFVASYDRMTARLPEMFKAYMPFFASGCNAQRLAVAEVFFADEDHRTNGTEDQLRKVAEGVGDCVGLREREGTAVAAFLRQYASAR
jgi:alanyl aminopeptidase